jgi:hypothetical protein
VTLCTAYPCYGWRACTPTPQLLLGMPYLRPAARFVAGGIEHADSNDTLAIWGEPSPAAGPKHASNLGGKATQGLHSCVMHEQEQAVRHTLSLGGCAQAAAGARVGHSKRLLTPHKLCCGVLTVIIASSFESLIAPVLDMTVSHSGHTALSLAALACSRSPYLGRVGEAVKDLTQC